MKLVVDSSVAFKWAVREVDTDKALRLREHARAAVHQLPAPDVFPIELAHGLTKAERQGRISRTDGWAAWLAVMADAPSLHPSLSLMPRAYAISSEARIGIYDCLYVALAEEEGCQLVTADSRLATVLQKKYAFIVELSLFP
jgi:predicted nucleic acid-binding protein